MFSGQVSFYLRTMLDRSTQRCVGNPSREPTSTIAEVHSLSACNRALPWAGLLTTAGPYILPLSLVSTKMKMKAMTKGAP